MAAKRARPDKKVLSRQEIASRKKALSTRRTEGGGAGRRALLGVALLALSSLALVALLTDPGPRALRGGSQRGGAGGTRPRRAAWRATRSVRRGHSAGGGLHRRRPPGGRPGQAPLAAGGLRGHAPRCDLRGRPARPGDAEHRIPGCRPEAPWGWRSRRGWWTSSTSGEPPSWSGRWRSPLCWWRPSSRCCAAWWRWGTLLAALGQQGCGPWASPPGQPSRRLWAARVEARAAARLEEAAFLAQLEADEEELSDAEAMPGRRRRWPRRPCG